MSELVVIVPDVYFEAGRIPRRADGAPGSAGALPGLARLARFGAASPVPQGWRASAAVRLGRGDLAGASPAAVAAAAPPADAHTADFVRTAQFIWLADPVHLLAGMTSLHLAPRGVLALDARAQSELCSAFDTAFAQRGYRLAPTRTGRFLASGPAPAGDLRTTEPARAVGSSLAEALPQGAAAGALLSIGAEIEMWLHEHPLNARRARAGLPPISTLWLWGGGAPLDAGERLRDASVHSRVESPRAAVFSDDAYMAGLAHLAGARIAPGPRISPASGAAGASALAPIVGDPAPCRIVTIELLGAADAPLQGLEALDREWIAPALDLLARRELARLTLILNDRRLTIAAGDRLKVWRRRRAALEALQ